MLRSGINNSNSHFCFAKERTNFLEFMITNPYKVVEGFVNSVYTFVAGSMSTLAVSNKVENHQSLFGNSWLHTGRFSNNGNINFWKFG